MASEQSRGSRKEVIENGLRNVQSFLRNKANIAVLIKKDGSPSPSSTNPSSPRTSPTPRGASGGSAKNSARSLEESKSAGHSPPPSLPDSLDTGVMEACIRDGKEETSTSGKDAAVSRHNMCRPVSEHRMKKFKKLLAEPVVDVEQLSELAWSGIPGEFRPTCWKLLLGYLPPNQSRQAQVLARKRREYQDMVPEYYDIANSERSEDELGALRQVAVDAPRTAPGVPFFHEGIVQTSLQRMLYIWGIRHPASGYVQGMNDLVTPFMAVFLSEHLQGAMDTWLPSQISEEAMLGVEADCYWCLCKMLEAIQDHYTYAQPGIQRTVFRLKELIRRIDEPLGQHLEDNSVDFLQFAFRWVNCLLVRELPFQLGVRLWDTYLAEGAKFADFLVYVCASFLMQWTDQLKEMDFQELLLFLQKLPTQEWDEQQMELVLTKAYIWRTSFDQAQSHLKS